MRSRSESFCSGFSGCLGFGFSNKNNCTSRNRQKQEQELSLPLGERATLTSHSAAKKRLFARAKIKAAKRSAFPTAEWLVKHALPPRPRHYVPRVHSAVGIFRHDILVVSKNDVHPCTPPLRGLVRRLRRYGREPERQKLEATATATATANCALPVEQEEEPLSRPFLVYISGACITPCAVQPTGGTRTTPAPQRQR